MCKIYLTNLITIVIYKRRRVLPPGSVVKLYRIVLKDLKRRRWRVLYTALGVVIGTMTVVGILTLAQAGEARIYDQIEKYGPNLPVIPATNNIEASVGKPRIWHGGTDRRNVLRFPRAIPQQGWIWVPIISSPSVAARAMTGR